MFNLFRSQLRAEATAAARKHELEEQAEKERLATLWGSEHDEREQTKQRAAQEAQDRRRIAYEQEQKETVAREQAERRQMVQLGKFDALRGTSKHKSGDESRSKQAKQTHQQSKWQQQKERKRLSPTSSASGTQLVQHDEASVNFVNAESTMGPACLESEPVQVQILSTLDPAAPSWNPHTTPKPNLSVGDAHTSGAAALHGALALLGPGDYHALLKQHCFDLSTCALATPDDWSEIGMPADASQLCTL